LLDNIIVILIFLLINHFIEYPVSLSCDPAGALFLLYVTLGSASAAPGAINVSPCRGKDLIYLTDYYCYKREWTKSMDKNKWTRQMDRAWTEYGQAMDKRL